MTPLADQALTSALVQSVMLGMALAARAYSRPEHPLQDILVSQALMLMVTAMVLIAVLHLGQR